MRILIAGALAGLAMFLWSGLANLALPLGTAGLSKAPDERGALAVLGGAFAHRSGMYVIPFSAMSGKAPPGSSAVVVYQGQGEPFGVTPPKLAAELAVELVLSILAAALLALTRLRGYWPRVGFVVGLGVFAAGMTNASNTIWFDFPPAYGAGYATIQLIGFLIAGLVIAALVKPRAEAA